MWERSLSPIEQELGSGEKLLWSGQPRTGLRLRASDAYAIPFTMLWCGFTIFWETLVIRGGAPFFMLLWGVPFVLLCIYMVIGRFFVDAIIRGKTFYAVTSERIIIVTGLFSKGVRSLNLRTLPEIWLNERRDGSGTITFGPVYATSRSLPAGAWREAACNPPASLRSWLAQWRSRSVQWSGSNAWTGYSRNMPPAIEMIENAKAVYEIVRHAQTALTL